MSALLLDGPRNGDYATVADAFATGYVFDAPTSNAWAAVGESGDVMVHEVNAVCEELMREAGDEGFIELLVVAA